MISAIIVAAGRGTRMGPNIDKLFLPLAGRPLVAHTWARFASIPAIAEIVLVVRAGMEPAFAEMREQFQLKTPVRFVAGGPERQDSVWNGLQALSNESEIVLIQDGARPCTSADVILRTVEAAKETGAAVAAQRVTDTIKESDGGTTVVRTVDRSRLWSVQTPQTFRVAVIRDALKKVRALGKQVTDDTTACELIGQPVTLVESFAPNPKATSKGDLPLLEMLLQNAALS